MSKNYIKVVTYCEKYLVRNFRGKHPNKRMFTRQSPNKTKTEEVFFCCLKCFKVRASLLRDLTNFDKVKIMVGHENPINLITIRIMWYIYIKYMKIFKAIFGVNILVRGCLPVQSFPRSKLKERSWLEETYEPECIAQINKSEEMFSWILFIIVQ